MGLYFGCEPTRDGGWMGNYISRDELGLSIEPAMRQVHGNIPETRWTRGVRFGFAMGDNFVSARLWINGDRCPHEGPSNFGAWSVYWSRTGGWRFDNYLRRVFFARNPDGSWSREPVAA